jgi:hypothetical protein
MDELEQLLEAAASVINDALDKEETLRLLLDQAITLRKPPYVARLRPDCEIVVYIRPKTTDRA